MSAEHQTALINAIRARVGETPGLREALLSLLERHAVSARLPRHMTLAVDDVVAAALQEIFSSGAVSRRAQGRFRLDLSKALAGFAGDETELVSVLSAALGRPAVSLTTGDRAQRLALRSTLLKLQQDARHEPTRRWLGAEARALSEGESELQKLAVTRGQRHAETEASVIARAMDAAVENEELLRVQRFSALALGDSKALRWGGERFRRLCAALYDHSPETRRRVHELGDPVSVAAAQALALEAHGIYRDVAAASVLCFGRLVYQKGAEIFADVARHAARGECARLTVSQLAGAEVVRPDFRRVRLIENLTPFLDYVEACHERDVDDVLVVCTGGQASWAVVRLMRLLAPFRLDMACSCDLDRSGVLIWRSLMRRTGVRLAPWYLDLATLRRYAERGQPISADERARLAALLERDSDAEPGHDLLLALLAAGVWVEQEAFSDETLLAEGRLHDPASQSGEPERE